LIPKAFLCQLQKKLLNPFTYRPRPSATIVAAMGIDRGLDPTTGDYVASCIDHLGNAVYVRLMTPLGSWWADSSLGSRLHELERCKDLARIHKLAVQYSEQALAPLITDGRAKAIRVSAEQPHDGRCLLHIEVDDAMGRTATFQHAVRVY